MADPENRRIPGAGGPGSSNIVDATSTTENGSTANNVHAALEELSGLRIYGGCDSCDAFQTIAARGSGVYVLTIHNDECCQHWPGVESKRCGAAGGGHR